MSPTRLSLAIFAAFGLAGCVATGSTAEGSLAQGQRLAQANCASCHAIALSDESPRADAPPLRDLYKRYPNEALRRAVSQGIHLGHADMPVFRLGENDAAALAAYLWSLNPCAQPSSDTEAMDRCFSRL